MGLCACGWGRGVCTWLWDWDFLDFDAEVWPFIHDDAGEAFFWDVECRLGLLRLRGRHCGAYVLAPQSRRREYFQDPRDVSRLVFKLPIRKLRLFGDPVFMSLCREPSSSSS